MTVAVCTHNRARLLRLCLEGIARQTRFDCLDVLVVDNASTDNTRTVCEEAMPSARYVYEEKPGIANARQRALDECQCDVLAYLDDDVIPADDWAAAVMEVFETTGAAGVGGRTLLYWEKRKPFCVSSPLYPLLGATDCGEDVIPMRGNYPHGANMAYLAEALRQVGGFDPRLGVCSVAGREETVLLGEEVQVGIRVAQNGGPIYYCGKAVVHHFVNGQRGSLRGLRERALQTGHTWVELGHRTIDVDQYAYDCIWSSACGVSSLLRLRLRDAVVYYVVATMRYSVLAAHCRQDRQRRTAPSLLLWKAFSHNKRGVLGIARSTLLGPRVEPPVA